MHYLLDVALAFISCILPLEQICQGGKKVVDYVESFGQKTIANVQAAVDHVTGLPKVWQDQVASCLVIAQLKGFGFAGQTCSLAWPCGKQ